MLVQTEQFEKINDRLIQQTLIPYHIKDTVYLKEATAGFQVSNTIGDSLKRDENYMVKGLFSISESCYIDDTGHFNAVEFNICYNQLFYVAIAHACSQKLIKFLSDLTLEEFYIQQLPNIFITHLESYYKRVINPRKFTGVWCIKKCKITRKMTVIKTEIEFTDDNDGLAYGKVDVVIKS